MRQITLFGQHNRQPTANGIASDPASVNAAADDENVDGVCQCVSVSVHSERLSVLVNSLKVAAVYNYRSRRYFGVANKA